MTSIQDAIIEMAQAYHFMTDIVDEHYQQHGSVRRTIDCDRKLNVSPYHKRAACRELYKDARAAAADKLEAALAAIEGDA